MNYQPRKPFPEAVITVLGVLVLLGLVLSLIKWAFNL
jgi:hypothetical protein